MFFSVLIFISWCRCSRFIRTCSTSTYFVAVSFNFLSHDRTRSLFSCRTRVILVRGFVSWRILYFYFVQVLVPVLVLVLAPFFIICLSTSSSALLVVLSPEPLPIYSICPGGPGRFISGLDTNFIQSLRKL